MNQDLTTSIAAVDYSSLKKGGEFSGLTNEVYFVAGGRHELVDKVEVDAEHMFTGYTNYQLIKKYKNR